MMRVLIVDDDQSIRETLRVVLEDAGYDVVEAADGMAALDVLRASKDSLVVLLDLMMPKLDGAAVLGAVAADRKLVKRHGYVMMTASHLTLNLAFANLLTNLMVPVLHKPFELDDVLAAVERVADRLETRVPARRVLPG